MRKPSHDQWAKSKRDMPLSGSSDQAWGLELFSSLCGHSLMLGYTTDKNPYKFPDTEIINYPFYPSVTSLKIH